jgi:serine/threonine protein kinase
MNSITNKEWKLPFEEIIIFHDRLLGEGQYGKVYLGKWRHIYVALKMFDSMNLFQWKELMNEFNILTRLHHPNIVQLLGYVE